VPDPTAQLYPNFRFFPVDEVTVPRMNAQYWVDYWWLVDAEGRVAWFLRAGLASAQCNSAEAVVRHMGSTNSLYGWFADARQIPLVFQPKEIAEMNRRADPRAERW
jgi:hypothetical protein